MTPEEQEKTKQIAYAEAMRYMSNATETLQRAGKEDGYYHDRKYVKTACGTAYSGVLFAINTWLTLKGVRFPKKEKNTNIEFYQANVAKLDLKMLAALNNAYDQLHLLGYYRARTNAAAIKSGFDSAYYIISKIKPEHELPYEEVHQPAWWRHVAAMFAW